MKYETIAAYLEGLSKYRRMTFFFLEYLFCFRDIYIFVVVTVVVVVNSFIKKHHTLQS